MRRRSWSRLLVLVAIALGWHYVSPLLKSGAFRSILTGAFQSQSGDKAGPAPRRGTHSDNASGADPAVLRVGTWNVKRLGHGKKRLDQVAEIIEKFDVVALQEVMSVEAVEQLLAYLPGFRAEVSPRSVGRPAAGGKAGYAEWYAVLYRSDRAVVERAFFTRDARDRFARDPFVVCLRAREFDFCLVTIHVIYGDRARARDREITALGATLRELRGAGPEQDWVVAGDFNRMPSAPGWDSLRGAGCSFTAPNKMRTSLGKTGYRNAYDHILVDPKATRELIGSAEKIDIVTHACNGDFLVCSRDLTDHAPVMARFRTTGPDDD